jgi:hypothetical protein
MVHWALRVSNSEMTFSQGQVSDPALSAGENKGLCGDVRQYVAQGNPQFDAEIAASGSVEPTARREKGHLWMETNLPT